MKWEQILESKTLRSNRVAIASTVFVGAAVLLGIFIYATFLPLPTPGTGATDGSAARLLIALVLSLVDFGLLIAGLVLAIVAVSQRDRPKTLAVIILIVCLLLIAAAVALTLGGTTFKPPSLF
ncbi:glucan phosphoethanolaminetransferase (alkaline phosphatase superfamily) [Glaciihabitans sp. UYNi722]